MIMNRNPAYKFDTRPVQAPTVSSSQRQRDTETVTVLQYSGTWRREISDRLILCFILHLNTALDRDRVET